MKTIITLLSVVCIFCSSFTLIAQDSAFPIEDQNENFLERHPIYDYTDPLTNSYTIPGFDTKPEKLIVTGIIYESDGVTPAKDVIMFMEQPDEHGDFDLRKENDKRYVYNRGWIKTDADGRYTFYTYVPGGDRFYNQMQQLFPAIKEPAKEAYDLPTFLFDEDPLLTKRCRRRIQKKDDPTRIMTLKKNEDGVFVATRNIIL